MYCLNEKNNFELMKVKEEGTGDKVHYKMNNGMDYDDFTTLCNLLGDSCRPGHESYRRYYEQLRCMNHVMAINVNEFAEVVDELSEYKIKDQVDLQVAYGNILKEFGLTAEAYDEIPLTGYPVVGTMKTEYGYYLVRTSGNAELIQVNKGKDLYKALESAGGRKVTRIECVGDADVPEDLKIPEGITYLNGLWEQEDLKSVELPDTLKEIGSCAFEGCTKLQQIQLPGSIEKIGSYAFYECTKLQQIKLPNSVKKIGEDAFDIMEGLPPVIIAREGSYAQKYAVKNDLEWSDQKLGKTELVERKLTGEALTAYQDYVDEWDGDTEILGMALAYINDDNIPECIIWTYIDSTYLGNNNILLSYTADGMIEEDLGFSQLAYEGIRYSPKAGKISNEYWVNGYGESYTVYSFDRKLVPYAEINNFMAAVVPEYTVNGENYGSYEAIEEYMSSLGLEESFTEDDVCYDVREAYDNLKKVD